jgi:hypothetical protein
VSDLIGRQREFNQESRDRWESFAGHREKVTRLLGSGVAPATGRLCVLGAGNCNDLGLATLLETYREVHLVDLDAEALAAGLRRQSVATHPGLHQHGNFDVTGMLDVMSTWSPQARIDPTDVAACADVPVQSIAPLLPGPFEVVVSTCLLSQLILYLVHTVGEGHPQFLMLLQSVRAGHLRLLTHLVAPGGTAILITDVVSSETVPTLGSVPDAALSGLLARLIRERNFFHGVNPAVLDTLATHDPVLRTHKLNQETLSPWRWDLGPRLYLVSAMRYRIPTFHESQ